MMGTREPRVRRGGVQICWKWDFEGTVEEERYMTSKRKNAYAAERLKTLQALEVPSYMLTQWEIL
jgi:hypothetical protein